MDRKSSKWFCGIAFILIGALLLTSPAWAQSGGFSEDFEDSQLTGWELSPDAILIEGALRLSPGNFAFKMGEWSDFTLEVRVRSEGSGEILVHYFARDESRYLLHILPEEVLLEKAVGERGEMIGSVGTEAIQTGNWIDLTIQVSQGEHWISIERELILEVTDTEPLETGAIGFIFHGEGYAEFDDVEVTVVGEVEGREGEPPLEGMEGIPPEEGPLPEGEQGPPPEGGEIVSPEPQPLGEGSSQEMDGGGWLEDFLSGQAQPLEMQTFVINLVLSAVLAFILGRVYIHWGTSLSNRRVFAANFVLITITTTFIILIVRSSIALSLGLVGALSIVRFRAAIKEPEELAYLFFAIGIGIGLGDNQRLITLLALVVGILIIGVVRLFHTREADVNLHLTVASGNPENVELKAILQTLDPHCAKLKLLRYDESGSAMEASFLVEFKALEKMQEARAALRALSPSLEMTFLDNRGIG